MNKKLKLILLGGAMLAVALVGINASIDKSANWNLVMKNAEALADNENGYGWLWEKHWVDCYTAGSITVHSSGGGISAGTYAYNTTFLARVKELHLSVTVIEPGPGQKSYCYDGWSFCSEDDCR